MSISANVLTWVAVASRCGQAVSTLLERELFVGVEVLEAAQHREGDLADLGYHGVVGGAAPSANASPIDSGMPRNNTVHRA
jgi:hypothetical protein